MCGKASALAFFLTLSCQGPQPADLSWAEAFDAVDYRAEWCAECVTIPGVYVCEEQPEWVTYGCREGSR